MRLFMARDGKRSRGELGIRNYRNIIVNQTPDLSNISKPLSLYFFGINNTYNSWKGLIMPGGLILEGPLFPGNLEWLSGKQYINIYQLLCYGL